MPFPHRVVLGNLWLFGPLVKPAMLALGGPTAAVLRTTTVTTMVSAGDALNVVAPTAEVYVNHRVHPADTCEAVLARDKQVLDRIKLQLPNAIVAEELAMEGRNSEAAPPMSGPSFDTIAAVTADIYGVDSAPCIMTGGTDTNHYLDLCDEVYRHSPLPLHMKDLSMFHGENERISAPALAIQVEWYKQLVHRVDAAAAATVATAGKHL